MNGAFESPSATEDLARILSRESTEGIQEEGVVDGVEVCRAASPSKRRSAPGLGLRSGVQQEEAWPAEQTQSPWAVPPSTAFGE